MAGKLGWKMTKILPLLDNLTLRRLRESIAVHTKSRSATIWKSVTKESERAGLTFIRHVFQKRRLGTWLGRGKLNTVAFQLPDFQRAVHGSKISAKFSGSANF